MKGPKKTSDRFNSIPLKIEDRVRYTNLNIPKKAMYVRYPKERLGMNTEIGYFDVNDNLIATGFAHWDRNQLKLKNQITKLYEDT